MRNRNLGVVLSIACCWLAPFVTHARAASPAVVIPEAHYRFGTAIEARPSGMISSFQDKERPGDERPRHPVQPRE
jgi:hypothetical protein